MSCTSPLYRVDALKPGFLRLPSDFQARRKNDGVFLRKGERDYLINVHHFPKDLIQKLPCGQCTSCRLGRSKEWAIRCMHELEYHDRSLFVTLTYNDDFLPKGEWLSPSGDVTSTSLRKKDVQDFIKRLREHERRVYNNENIKVFYCGEYGDLNNRPHYHLILFGVSDYGDGYQWRVQDDMRAYRSPTLERLWSYYDRRGDFYLPMGHVEYSDVTFNSAAYVARYVMKKITGKPMKEFQEYYDKLIDPYPIEVQPFICMSRRPGIGMSYAKDHMSEIYSTDEVFYTKKFKAYASKPPRYYDKLYDCVDPEGMERVKEYRQSLAVAAASSERALYDGSEDAFLATRAELKDALYDLNNRRLL